MHKRTTHPGVENEEVSVAITISQDATSWHPAAAAIPFTLAMTGTGIFCSPNINLVHVSKTFW